MSILTSGHERFRAAREVEYLSAGAIPSGIIKAWPALSGYRSDPRSHRWARAAVLVAGRKVHLHHPPVQSGKAEEFNVQDGVLSAREYNPAKLNTFMKS